MARRRGWAALAVVACMAAGCSSGGGSTADARVRVVSQNLLHGIACPADSDGCDLPGRVELFARQLGEKGCPDVVGVQEANARTVALLRADVAKVCGGRYSLVWDGDPGLDREVVLTRLRVLGSRRTRLAGPLRTALWVRVAADVGVVEFVTAHLASGSDDRPCDRTTCPPPCREDDTVNACQARQLVRFAAQVADDDAVVIVSGDFNAKAGARAISAIRAAGFSDTHLAAGNAECDPLTGRQCTSGRVDDAMTDLTDPTSRQSERIDYVFVGGSRRCTAVTPTGLFNASPAAGALAYAADHTGVQATLECRTTTAQRENAAHATVPPAPATTLATPGEVDAATGAAITEAFRTLFDGSVTGVDRKLAVLEDGEILRRFFVDSYEAQKEIAARVRVRIDDIRLVDDTHAQVTYTLLLDGAAVLDHLAGGALKSGASWLVTRRTYCDVSTQGAIEIPPPCR